MSGPPEEPGRPRAPGSLGDGEPPRPRTPPGAGGLCPTCKHVQVVTSGTGSSFLLCGLSRTDPRFRKYPSQPRMECSGHAG